MSSETKDKPKVVIIRETIMESVISDGVTFLMAVALVGMGWFIGSTVLEIVGAIVWFAFIVNRANSFYKDKTKTSQQAADWLLKEYGVSGKP